MKTTVYLFILIIGIYSNAYSQSDSNKSLNSELQFSIKFNKNLKKISEITVALTIKNNSKSRVVVKEVSQENEQNYTVELRNSKGEMVPFSAEGQRLIEPSKVEVSVIFVRIAPGEEITRIINLSRLFSFKKNEKYKVIVKKSVYIEASKSYRKLVSNPLGLQPT